jgi:hypothetical protein
MSDKLEDSIARTAEGIEALTTRMQRVERSLKVAETRLEYLANVFRDTCLLDEEPIGSIAERLLEVERILLKDKP